MSLLKAPCGVISHMEKLQRCFLWSGRFDVRGYHAVNWKLIKSEVTSGGLGIRDLRLVNISLLSKWFWRYASSPFSWWRQLLDIKNGPSHSLWRFTLNSGFGSWSFWKKISQCDSQFWDIAYVDHGDGLQISFWFDHWLKDVRESNLKSNFPRVFAVVSNKEVTLFDAFCPINRSWRFQYNVNLRGGARREMEAFSRLMDEQARNIVLQGSDSLSWPLEISGIFSVKSLYSFQASMRYPEKRMVSH
ncbi:Putative ribonuclease H protein At1g65750 [Linum grandiflorum]